MGRKQKIILLVLLLAGLLVYVAPNLLSVKEIGASLVKQASSAMEAEITVGQLRWNWDPLPHLTLVDTTVSHRDFVLRLPDSRIYPDWWALLAGRVGPGHLSLRSPDITLNPSFLAAPPGEKPLLPLAHVTVEGGTLHIPALTQGDITVKPQSFTGINLRIRKGAGHLAVSLQAGSSFAESLSLQGKFFEGGDSYSCTLEARKFQLTELIDSASPIIRPLAGETDFNCDIIGNGSQAVQVLYSGGLPAFSLRRLENPVAFTFTQAKLLLEKNGPDLSARIFELGVSEPRVSFSGKVSRSIVADTPSPRYRLELGAQDIDLSGVRGKLLALLGDEHITSTVCDIVRGGRAKSASFAFDAPLAEFANLSSMTIHVDVDQASIHVPEVDLDLERASGPIFIKNGEIHGYNLTTWLDSHYGSNGSFSLGLSEHNWLFKLDLDIDADLALLPQTLHHLIRNDDFRNEVLKFSAQGRKMGHLTIGEDLRDFTVDVLVPDMKDTEVNYGRLIWPVTLQAGALHIHGDEIDWRDVAAQAGPHALRDFSGKLNWADSGIPFVVDNFSGALEAKSLLEELNRYPWAGEALAPHVSSLAGAISVSRAKARGAMLTPSSWGYELEAALENISCDTPYLPQTVSIAKAGLVMATSRVALSGAEVTFLDSPLTLATDLAHDQFAGWRGWLELTGPLTQTQGDWLAAKDWLPRSFFPKIPCALDGFKIDFDGDDFTLLGSLRNKSPDNLPVAAGLDVRIRDGQHQSSTFHFTSGAKEGLITMTGDYSLSFPAISFQGSIDWRTVTSLFNSQALLGGEVQGEFTLKPEGMEREEGLTFAGQVQARNLQWLWGDFARPVTISSLSLQGDGQRLAINDLHFTFENETVSCNGDLFFTPQHIETDLALRAETLSQNTLSHFIEDLKVFLKTISGSADRLSTFSKKITGGIDIEAKEFTFAETIKEGKSESYKLTPLQGKIDFSEQGETTLFLTDSGFCGLDIDGALTWRNEQSSKEFILKNPGGSPSLFEDFLPCAGVKKRFLSGPFSVNATLTDANGTLSSGKFDLKGEEGVLEKMEILSKIFKLINFTDYYQGLFSGGFHYKTMEIHGHVAENLLILDKAVMEGEGMDIIAQGNINLHSLETDLTFFIVPFKSLDKIINMVPLVGRIVGGKKRHILTYPLRVTGPLKDPEITVLSPTAIGKAAIDFIFDTITFPLDMLPSPEEEK